MHKANIALNESARTQKHSPHVLGGFIVKTVKRFCCFGLFGEIHGLRRSCLHAIGKVIRTCPGGEFAVLRA